MSNHKSSPLIHYYSTIIAFSLLLTSFIQSWSNPGSLISTLLSRPRPFYFFRRSLRLTKSWYPTIRHFNWELCITLTLFVIATTLTLYRGVAL